MLGYNAAVMALLKRIGPQRERGLRHLPYSLVNDLSRSTYNMAARLSFQWEKEEYDNRRRGQYNETAGGEKMAHLDRIAETNRVPLVKQVPCILLCLQLSPPDPESSAASILNRFVLFNVPVRGRAPHVNAIFSAIILNLLPRPYPTARTINLILVVITIASIRIADRDTERGAGREWILKSVPHWVFKQNEDVGNFLAGLPRWMQALVPTTNNVDLTDIIDEIARRLPPADEGLAGDYIEVLTANTSAKGTDHDYSVVLRDVYNRSRKNAVTPAELMMLIPKLLSFSTKLNRKTGSARTPQSWPMLHVSSPAKRETLYSDFACTALKGALQNLSLLRHTDKILEVRELTAHEWLFITSVVTGREKAWAPTAYAAMRTATRLAEERRRIQVETSGKNDRDVSLLGFMGMKDRLMVLTSYATGMSDLRFDNDLFSAAVEYTEPLMREYFRALEADTTPSLRTLDTKYRIRQMLSVVTRADNLNETSLVEESEDMTEEAEIKSDLPRVKQTYATSGKATLSLLKALEKFLSSPMTAGPSTHAVSASPISTHDRTDSVEKDSLDQRHEGSIASGRTSNEDFIIRLHVVECAIVYCLCRFKELANGHTAPAELVELALRSTRRMRHIIGVHFRHISSVAQSSERNSRTSSARGERSSGAPADAAIVEGIRGEVKTLQLCWITVRLQVDLAARNDLTAEEHCALAHDAAALMADLTTFTELISDHHGLPHSFNRNVAILHRLYALHKRILRSSTAAVDVPQFQAIEENVRKLVVVCFNLLHRVLPPRHHQRRVATSASSSFDFYKKLVVTRTFDSAMSLALTANMTLNELPNISEVTEKTIDAIREASQIALQSPPSDAQRYEGERHIRSPLLLKVLHFLHHVCTLSINNEACLSAAAVAVGACAKEDAILLIPWRKRESILSMTAYVYRILSDRFPHSRASRDLGHQLLIMVSRMALNRLEYKESYSTEREKTERLAARELQLRRLVCAALIWQISCVVAPTVLQNVPMEKYLGVMHAYVKRNFVISMSTQAMGGDSSILGSETELAHCEQILTEANLSLRSCVQWRLTMTKEEVITRCNFSISEVVYSLKYLANQLHTETPGGSSQVLRARWLSQTELACGLLKRYQRWIAPSVWRSVWREAAAAGIVMRIGHLNSDLVQETIVVAAQRLLLFSKDRNNNGAWINIRARPTAISQEDVDAKDITVVQGNSTADRQLLSFVDLSRMFELQDQFTDMELRVYLVQLIDRLSEENEEKNAASSDTGIGLEEEEVGRPSDTQTEKYQRQLRTARNNILFTCRRIRS